MNENLFDTRSAIVAFGPDGYSFDPDDLGQRPLDTVPAGVTSTFDIGGKLTGFYVTANVEPVKGLHLSGSARHTAYKSNSFSEFRVGDVVLFGSTEDSSESAWVPSASFSLDVAPWLAAYGSFNDIFSPQNTTITPPTNADNSASTPLDYTTSRPLPPQRGETYEGGLRLRLRDGKLNGHLAYYDTRVQNRAVPIQVVGNINTSCCSLPVGKSISQGVDTELSGELTEGWQVAASYNYNKNRVSGFILPPGQPNVLFALFPKHQIKIWTSYDFLSGPLSGLTVAAGTRTESKRSLIGSACPPTGGCGFDTQLTYFLFTQAGYTVVDGLLNYRISDNLELSLNAYNLLDKKYFAQPSGVTGSNFYATPRSFMLTLRTILGERYTSTPRQTGFERD